MPSKLPIENPDSAVGPDPDDDSFQNLALNALSVALETYRVLDSRQYLDGAIEVTAPEVFESLVERFSSRQTELRLEVESLCGKPDGWQEERFLEWEDTGDQARVRFRVPLDKVGKGANRLVVSLRFDGGQWLRLSKPNVIHQRGTPFCVLEESSTEVVSPDEDRAAAYLAYVKDTVENSIEHQSARLGGEADGTLFVTTPHRRSIPRHRRLSFLDGVLSVLPLEPETPLEHRPFRMDFDAWPVLGLLTEATGDAQYHEMVVAMAEAFAEVGFHPRSGLPFCGEACDFDVLGAKPVSSVQHSLPPHFKGRDIPIDRLWEVAPEKMTRMTKATYYGLVVDPESLVFNRYCRYEWDDQQGEHCYPGPLPNTGLIAAAAYLMYWWGTSFARTGDQECLHWAARTFGLWRSAQHEDTGLMPYVYGSSFGKAFSPYASPRRASDALVVMLQAADEFRSHPQGTGLADGLVEMACRLALGIAKHGYDAERRGFRNLVHLDGRPYEQNVHGGPFPSQAAKEAAVREDPAFEEVPVFDVLGFYQKAPFWSLCASNAIPRQLAAAALRAKDPDLIQRLEQIATHIMEDAETVTSALSRERKWTFPATGHFIQFLVLLNELTGRRRYLDDACRLADQEIAHLSRIAYPQWWRMPCRNDFLTGLLKLYLALSDGT